MHRRNNRYEKTNRNRTAHKNKRNHKNKKYKGGNFYNTIERRRAMSTVEDSAHVDEAFPRACNVRTYK